MSFDSTIHAKTIDLIKLAYDMTAASGSGHPTSSASLGHLVTVLMYTHMRYEPANPSHPSSDRLILSEGHAVPIVYAACADLGVHFGKDPQRRRAMTRADAMTLRQIDSCIDGHPNPIEGFPFFDSATGSLGQGLSVAAGLAVADKLDGVGKRFFCIIGDGESREGQIWEAVEFIRDHNLKAVCPIFNCNVYAQSEPASQLQSVDTTARKLEAVGYTALIIDGHQPAAVRDALARHAAAMADPKADPVAIVARTVKGWGAASQQGHGHHGTPALGEKLELVKTELSQTARQLGAAADMSLKIPMMPTTKPARPTASAAPTLTQALERFEQADALAKGKMATRKAYGIALRALGHANPAVVALDADVKNSTFADMFAHDPQLAERFVECRIAEQNMVSVAAGLSAGGRIPFSSTFARFFIRAYDQIEMAMNSGANIKLVGSHAGISLAADGPSQMALADMAFFHALSSMRLPGGQPGFYVLQPADAYATYALTMRMAEHVGPCYMRTLRTDTEFLYSDDHPFTLGGHEVLSRGRDLLIVASGYMVHEANRALELLDQRGIDATLVDLYSLPFDSDALLDLANANNGMVLTLEDNYGGGFGAAVAGAAAADGGGFTVRQLHVRNLPKSGLSSDDLMRHCHVDVDAIVREAMDMLNL